MRSRTVLFSVFALSWSGVLSACSGPDETATDRKHDQRSIPALVGEQRYRCSDGAIVDADFMNDGLVLEMTRMPGGTAELLTAPATGLAFVGDKVNASFADGDRMIVSRKGASPVQCRRERMSSAPSFARDAATTIANGSTNPSNVREAAANMTEKNR